jgi:hypothetical protein
VQVEDDVEDERADNQHGSESAVLMLGCEPKASLEARSRQHTLVRPSRLGSKRASHLRMRKEREPDL